MPLEAALFLSGVLRGPGNSNRIAKRKALDRAES
jgi:hypothetical protein